MLHTFPASRVALAFVIVSAAGVYSSSGGDPTPPRKPHPTVAHVVTMTAIPGQYFAGRNVAILRRRHGGPDPMGQPESGIILRMDMYVGGVLVDYGTLSGRSIVTGVDGKAKAVYTAPPPAPPPGGNTINTVSIRATPIGFDAQTDHQAAVDIRLMPPGVILPPADTPVAAFQYSPSPVTTNTLVTFDASSSCGGPIVNIHMPERQQRHHVVRVELRRRRIRDGTSGDPHVHGGEPVPRHIDRDKRPRRIGVDYSDGDGEWVLAADRKVPVLSDQSLARTDDGVQRCRILCGARTHHHAVQLDLRRRRDRQRLARVARVHGRRNLQRDPHGCRRRRWEKPGDRR